MANDSPQDSYLSRVRGWYGKFERPISSLSLVGGFVFDALTLRRVDAFWENIWVVAHLTIIGLCIILINSIENKNRDEANPQKLHFWLVNILQFFFGGTLSVFLVFYFRSSTLAASWPFLLILALAFTANERLKRHYARLSFQISLFFLSLYSFFIFLLPILAHRLGPDIFLLSGVVSIIALTVFLVIVRIFARRELVARKSVLILSIAGLCFGINAFYFLNLIPPIPLSLKEAGVYHSLAVISPGKYQVAYEDQGPLGFFKSAEDVHLTAGESLYAYSAIFSPALLNTDIVHEWQLYDGKNGGWITVAEINLPVTGGSDQGYRTYSRKDNLPAGSWRVNVKTPQGQILGRLRFNIGITSAEPALTPKTIN